MLKRFVLVFCLLSLGSAAVLFAGGRKETQNSDTIRSINVLISLDL